MLPCGRCLRAVHRLGGCSVRNTRGTVYCTPCAERDAGGAGPSSGDDDAGFDMDQAAPQDRDSSPSQPASTFECSQPVPTPLIHGRMRPGRQPASFRCTGCGAILSGSKSKARHHCHTAPRSHQTQRTCSHCGHIAETARQLQREHLPRCPHRPGHQCAYCKDFFGDSRKRGRHQRSCLRNPAMAPLLSQSQSQSQEQSQTSSAQSLPELQPQGMPAPAVRRPPRRRRRRPRPGQRSSVDGDRADSDRDPRAGGDSSSGDSSSTDTPARQQECTSDSDVPGLEPDSTSDSDGEAGPAAPRHRAPSAAAATVPPAAAPRTAAGAPAVQPAARRAPPVQQPPIVRLPTGDIPVVPPPDGEDTRSVTPVPLAGVSAEVQRWVDHGWMDPPIAGVRTSRHGPPRPFVDPNKV